MYERITHRVTMYEEERSWECSCGCAGSVGEFGDVELASDKHIRPDEHRVDVHPAREKW